MYGRVCALLVAAVVFLGARMVACAGLGAAAPPFFTVQGATYEARFDVPTGRMAYLRPRGGTDPAADICSTQPNGSLWTVQFRNGCTLKASDFATLYAGGMKSEWISDSLLRLTYEAEPATVVVDVERGDSYMDLSLAITPRAGDVLRVALPASLDFGTAGLRRVVFPSELGIAFNKQFYERQPRPVGWQAREVGAAGLQSVGGFACDIRPLSDPPVPVTVTEAGRELLGQDLASEWDGRTCSVTRPPLRQPEVEIITSEKGTFLGGHRVGAGLLVHFGGNNSVELAPLVVRTVRHLAAALHDAARPTIRSRVVLMALSDGPDGIGATVHASLWKQSLVAEVLAEADMTLVCADSPKRTLVALSDPATFVIINPYGEAFPVLTSDWSTTAAAIRRFIENGGTWIETGGYPFYYAYAPSCFYDFTSSYPTAFSDFGHIETEYGRAGVFGVQDASDKGHILVPALWRTYGDGRGGHIERTWQTFVTRGATWKSPPVRVLVGPDAPSALETYALANGLTRALSEKVSPDLLQRWKRSLLVRVQGGNCSAQISLLDRLPRGSLIYLVDYLHGGFDKQYPDHLPPNPAWGSGKQLGAFIGCAHRLGHLVMPYTNCTWWCDEPPGPTFLAAGTDPLLRGLDGAFAVERYLANWGWSICPWHPAVIEASDRMVRQFTEEYPVDMLYQDQVGSRGLMYDTSPASPTCYAYTQGLIEMAERASEHIPVTTEDGYDRLIDSTAQFWGQTARLVPFWRWPWCAKPYRDLFPDSCWEFFPMAQWVAHDKAMFGHSLADTVEDARSLAWSLVLGYQLSFAVTPWNVNDASVQAWMGYLDGIQKDVVSRCVGEPLVAFRYLAGSGSHGVIEAVYGSTHIIANLTDQPYTFGAVTIPPGGFHAER
jgi:hypothetical protein